jgi:hypothetical protein
VSRLNEKVVTGDMITYRRGGSGYFYNNNNPQITFNIDEVTILPDKTTYTKESVDSLTVSMSTPDQVFNLLNPETNEVIGTAKFQDVFEMLYSLFFYVPDVTNPVTLPLKI